MSVAIIGGGLGGLAAACTLAARGHKVTLFESSTCATTPPSLARPSAP